VHKLIKQPPSMIFQSNSTKRRGLERAFSIDLPPLRKISRKTLHDTHDDTHCDTPREIFDFCHNIIMGVSGPSILIVYRFYDNV
jgi:hypothetical protein